MTLTPEPATHAHDGRLKRLWIWAKLMFDNMSRSRSFGLAAEMAFWLFLSLIPLAAVLGLVAARFAASNSDAVAPLLQSLPGPTRTLIGGELGKVSAWNGGAVGLTAALTFVWLASSGVHSVFDALEVATEATARPWWKKRLLAIATCVALSVGAALLTLVGTGFDWLQHLTDGHVANHAPRVASTIEVVLRFGLGALIAFGLMAGLYWVGLPPMVRKRMPIVPGALFAVLLQGLSGFGYGLYIRTIGDGGAYQAGLAVIGVTMMALYLFSVAILAGAELNRTVGARRTLRGSVHREAAPPPAVTDDMVRCDDESERPSHRHYRRNQPRASHPPSPPPPSSSSSNNTTNSTTEASSRRRSFRSSTA